MAVLALQPAGVLSLVAANAGGDTIAQGAMVGGWGMPALLIVRNTDVAAKTVTVAGVTPVVVPATTGLALIPVVGPSFVEGGQPVNRAVSYSAVTGLTVAGCKLGPW